MPDILQQLVIGAPIDRVYAAISTSEGLSHWWTETALGAPVAGAQYRLGFTAAYQWQAVVITCQPPTRFVLRLTDASADWVGTEVDFTLRETPDGTLLDFAHRGWPETSDHFRISAHCWACYLRILRRWLTHGELVPYETRLDV